VSAPAREARALRWTLATVFVALLAAAVCVGTAAQAAPSSGKAAPREAVRDPGIAWRNQRFVYKAEGKRLSEVLVDFAASQGLPAVVADGVEGVVQASFDATPQEFLAAVSKAYGIIWYHDGAAIYFYPSRAIQSRIFRLKGYSGQQVDRLLRSLQLTDRRYPLRYDPAEQTLLVYGPPRHVELVSAAVESLDAGAGEMDQPVSRVFPLRYAWAADRKVGTQTVPGVASVLRSLYQGQGAGGAEAADGVQSSAASNEAFVKKAAALTRTYGIDRMSPKVPSEAGRDGAGGERSLTGAGPRGVRSPLEAGADVPTFQADEATNAVLVRGRRSRMAEYADVIRRLDLKPTLIELEAMIIDVSSDSVDSLGIAWSASDRRAGVSVLPPNSPALGTAQNNPSGSFQITTLWQNAGRELLARVHALEADGKARIVAKPRVLGVANRPALMQEKRVANVRVAGNLDTSLYQVEAGTELQVTPQVTFYGPQCRMKLSIFIVDGKFEDAQVDQVPVVKHTEILTEAQITEGESLLIGGISVETETTRRSGVPGLSRAPLVGGLFRWEDKQRNRSERLFLLTPRVVREQVVDVGVAGAEPAPPPSSAALPPAGPAPAPRPAPTPARDPQGWSSPYLPG
jgi:type III secretion protein C